MRDFGYLLEGWKEKFILDKEQEKNAKKEKRRTK